MKLLASAIALLAALSSAHAQKAEPYPTGTVKALVGYPAGQTTDFIARTISERLSQKWGVPVVIENIAGAGSTIAASTAARAKRDGHTLLFTANAAMVIGPHLYKKLTYKTFDDFEFVNNAIWVPYVCSVSPSLPVKDMAGLKKYVTENPGKVSYGSPGVSTIAHLTMERLKGEHGIDVLHVPYKGSAAVLTDLASGSIQFACEPASISSPFIQSGKIRPIAVASEKRLAAFPNVPTIGETFAGFTSGAWVGVVVPKGTSRQIIDRLNADISAVLSEKATLEKFEQASLVVVNDGPEKFTKLARDDDKAYGDLIRKLGIEQ